MSTSLNMLNKWVVSTWQGVKISTGPPQSLWTLLGTPEPLCHLNWTLVLPMATRQEHSSTLIYWSHDRVSCLCTSGRLPGTRTRAEPAAASVILGSLWTPACVVLRSSFMEVGACVKSLQRVPESLTMYSSDPTVRSSLVVGVEVVEVVEEVEEMTIQDTIDVMSVF